MSDGTSPPRAQPPPRLFEDDELTGHSVVANSTMNRERGLAGVNSYTRELGFDPAEFLTGQGPAPSWLDLCSGEGLALRSAARQLPGASLTGVDLVGPLRWPPVPDGLELVTADLGRWSPKRRYDLITCVHGLHYIGDRLGLLERSASWLTDTGLLVAHLDPSALRRPDGTDASRTVLAALRAAGFRYSARHHRLSLRGGRQVVLPFAYLGADPHAGPNYTGQPTVASYYRATTPEGRPAAPG
ncbi:methyltransferase domain-containing protein [Streptomyces sp. Qhu-G9]|uniref:class I SAM-dependent methyltransferase n=1 Tax=Streptomyces sp. Qhu-G9 TaxID=3452799 RepID=UPI0022ABD213|nr:methyltransferase domain-containing protein [Streptomyces aurantiacus]WAU83274.1 methyltransferase domain-containing protein [Streptomyces aurantiacus]